MCKITTKATVPVETGGKNTYLYDRRLKKTILSHPILYFLSQVKVRGEDPGEWVENIPGDTVDIPGTGSFPKDEVRYYVQKLRFLESSGYFSEVPQEKIISRQLKADDIKISLANLIQITLEITDACQLDCMYCGYGKFYCNYDKRERKFMDFSTVKRLVEYLREYLESPINSSHNRPIYIGFYGGEPLLNFPLIKQSVEYINGLVWTHNKIRFTITTNGLLLDKYIDFIVEHDFNLFISLDGDESNNAYRVLKNGKSSFKKIAQNIEMIREKYPEYYENRVNFNAVLHNKNGVDEIFKFFNDKLDKKPNILSLNTGGIREDQADEFWNTYVNEKESLYNSEDYSRIEQEMFIKLPTLQSFTGFLFRAADFNYDNYNDFFTTLKEPKRYPTDTCMPFSRKLFLTVNGKIMACERIGQNYALGQMDEDGITVDFEEIAHRYNQWFAKIRKLCQACYLYDQCTQCIFYIDLDEEKATCGNFMNRQNYSKYFASFLNYFEKSPALVNRIIEEVNVD